MYKFVKHHGFDALEYTDKDGNKEYLVNAMNHPAHILNKDRIIEIPQSGIVARVRIDKRDTRSFCGFKVDREIHENIYGLPEPIGDTNFIVSSRVVSALNGSRPDVIRGGPMIKGRGDKVITHFLES